MSGGVFDPAGFGAQTAAEVGWVLVAGAALLFGVTMGLLAAALWWRRRGPPNERRWIIGGGVVLPLLVLLPLLVYATLRHAALEPPRQAAAGRETVIAIDARMWWWQVRHDDAAAPVVLANELHLPVGRAVTLALASSDVIHSFWVPALAGKVDMVPGRMAHLRVRADRAGVFRGPCAEYCGAQHARMLLHVVAHDGDGYARWLAAQALPAAPPADALAQQGLAAYQRLRCAACHDIRGLVPGSAIGPDLTHVGSRIAIGAGALPTTRANLAAWVADSQHAKPGVRMPAYAGQLDPAALDAVAAFLEQLR